MRDLIELIKAFGLFVSCLVISYGGLFLFFIREVEKMRIPKIYRGEYLCCLPPELYRSIIDAVEFAIGKLYLSENNKKEALYNANCEKLYNLTDTINIVFI